MGGWIKLEKDLREDPRVLRMARGIDQRYLLFAWPSSDGNLDPSNATALPAVTLVLGGLMQLWSLADSFARDDDTLDISPDEIDQLTGIKGFAELMPRDWLEVLDAEHVKLPGFHEHNGIIAKRKALTARRVTQHRYKVKRSSVTSNGGGRNATALPDQDQTKTRLDQDPKRGSRVLAHPRTRRVPESFQITEAMRNWAEREVPETDIERETALFRDHEFKDPHGDWPAAWRKWMRRAPEFQGRGSGQAAEPKLTWRPPAEDPEYGEPDAPD